MSMVVINLERLIEGIPYKIKNRKVKNKIRKIMERFEEEKINDLLYILENVDLNKYDSSIRKLMLEKILTGYEVLKRKLRYRILQPLNRILKKYGYKVETVVKLDLDIKNWRIYVIKPSFTISYIQ